MFSTEVTSRVGKTQVKRKKKKDKKTKKTYLLIKPHQRLKRTLFKHLPTGTKQHTKHLGQTLFSKQQIQFRMVSMTSKKPMCAPPPSLRSFPNVAFETVPMLVWIIRGETHSIRSQKGLLFVQTEVTFYKQKTKESGWFQSRQDGNASKRLHFLRFDCRISVCLLLDKGSTTNICALFLDLPV